jgi:uncharacterized protein with HEPN domain
MNVRDQSVLIHISKKMSIISDLIDGHILESFLKDERTKRAVAMSLINIRRVDQIAYNRGT